MWKLIKTIKSFINLKTEIMKAILFLLFAGLLISNLMAQDVITRKDSSKINANILEINPIEIKYRLFNYADGPMITISKTEVAYILYKNGIVERFTQPVIKQDAGIAYHPDKYNLDRVSASAYYCPEKKVKDCEKLYSRKNYLGFNYITFLNTCLGFNYMRDIRKANLIINVPFAFGVGSPSVTNELYSRNYLDRTSSTRYDLMRYQVGLNVLFAPSMTREVNFLMGPSFNLSEFKMSVNTKYTSNTALQNQYNNETFSNQFVLRREHYGMNIGFLARFSEKVNMNMLITFGYKKDTYSEKDPYGIEYLESHAKQPVMATDNVMPYVNFAWSVGYRF